MTGLMTHLVERAAERMAPLGGARKPARDPAALPADAAAAPPPALPPEAVVVPLAPLTLGQAAALQPGTIEPGTIKPGTIKPGTIEPGTIEPGTIEPGSPQAAPAPAAPAVPVPQAAAASAEAALGTAPRAPAPAPVAVAVAVSLAMLEAAGMAVTGARRSRIAEEWRLIGGQLLRELRTVRPAPIGNAAANLLMVTSSKPNEGKSFSALNLSGSLALGGLAEVLLIDIDSKPGALSEILGLGERPGLFDMVADPALRPDDLVLQTAIAGLAVLPIGRAALAGPGSAERTVSRPVVALIERLARHFANHVVVLDSAPCLATSDASTLAPTVGHIAMVVEAERTQRHDLEAALELLRPCPSITLVLNKVRLVTNHAFGDYHYYDG